MPVQRQPSVQSTMSMKCAFKSSKLPLSTTTSTWQPQSTVSARSSGVQVCFTLFHVPCTSTNSPCTNAIECCESLDFGLWSKGHLTFTSSTYAPEYWTIIHPRLTPEMMKSEPWAPVLFEPVIEWIVGCKDAGTGTSPHGGPQPIVYSLSSSQAPV